MSDKFLTLICPPGAADYPISHGTRNFTPYREDHRNEASRWLVDVPLEAAQHFVRIGGFSIMPITTETLFAPGAMQPAVPPAEYQVMGGGLDLAVVRHQDDPRASPGNFARPIGEGRFVVHRSYVPALASHGFVLAPEAVPADLIEKDGRDEEIARLRARLAELEPSSVSEAAAREPAAAEAGEALPPAAAQEAEAPPPLRRR